MFKSVINFIKKRLGIKAHQFYDSRWDVKHIRDGKIIWEMTDIRNALVDEGEKNMLNTYFRQAEEPSEFYIRLCYDSLVETDTLATIQNEPVGNGYTPQLVERSVTGFPTIEMDLGDWRIISKEVQFNAVSGDYTPVNTLFLATTSDNTGKLLAFVNMRIERTVLSGDVLLASLKIKLK